MKWFKSFWTHPFVSGIAIGVAAALWLPLLFGVTTYAMPPDEDPVRQCIQNLIADAGEWGENVEDQMEMLTHELSRLQEQYVNAMARKLDPHDIVQEILQLRAQMGDLEDELDLINAKIGGLDDALGCCGS